MNLYRFFILITEFSIFQVSFMFILFSSKILCNAFFSEYLKIAVSLFVYLLYLVYVSIARFLGIVSFFLQTCFKHVVIYGLSGLIFFILPCVMLLI